MGVAKLLRETNQNLFPSRAYTRQITENGQYMIILSRLQIVLGDWRRTSSTARRKFTTRLV